MKRFVAAAVLSLASLIVIPISAQARVVDVDGPSVATPDVLAPVGAMAAASFVAATAPTPVQGDYVATGYIVTAGANGAFAYCDRGRLAFNPCSLAYYSPGTRVSVNPIQINLASDSQNYWVVPLTYWLPAPYNQSVTYAAYIPTNEVS
jgi:hypothetical protein